MEGYKILIVEDEIIAALSLKETLERSGHVVTDVATTSTEAMASLESELPDLVLMDINLEDKDDGIIIGKSILNTYKLPVIFITAYADKETISRAREVFPYGYLVKPWQEGELLAVLETAVYKHLADQKTLELQQTRNKFFSIIGHDLRSPLAALKVTTRTLNKHLQNLSKHELKEFIEDIQLTVENLYAFTDNMLEWARIQSGGMEVNAQPLPIATMVEEVFALLREKAFYKEVALSIDIPQGLAVQADKNMFRSILLNLVSNGIKFSYPGGSVQVRAEKEEDQVHICVSDKGTGLDRSQMEKLLTFTSAIHTPGTQDEKGTGLGLLLCKEFVEANEGTLSIDSQLNVGTTVRVSLPQAIA